MNWDLVIYDISQVVPYVMTFVCYFILSKRVANMEKELHIGWKSIEKVLEVFIKNDVENNVVTLDADEICRRIKSIRKKRQQDVKGGENDE